LRHRYRAAGAGSRSLRARRPTRLCD
jgi:hypothetical protein